MNSLDIYELLQSLINAKAPCGVEDEVRVIIENELKNHVDEMWVDPCGNLIAKIQGDDADESKAINVMVHMDELSLIVKRINEDGSLRVNPLGGIHPFNFGQGPVDIMGDNKTFSGILSFGCMHTTKETQSVNKMSPEDFKGLGKTVGFEDVTVITRMSLGELKELGVHPGTRVVISHERRKIHHFQDCVASYFLDNRASIAIVIAALKNIKQKGKKPAKSIFFVATCSEEIGAHGASYAARTLPGSTTLAIDVGPVAKEYNTVLNSSPIVVYQDAVTVYDKKISDHLIKIGESLKLNPQSAVFGSYGSDASLAYSRGQSARAALLSFPVENTHGFEIAHKDSFLNCSKLLESYLIER